jgi:hypothetical protein
LDPLTGRPAKLEHVFVDGRLALLDAAAAAEAPAAPIAAQLLPSQDMPELESSPEPSVSAGRFPVQELPLQCSFLRTHCSAAVTPSARYSGVTAVQQ